LALAAVLARQQRTAPDTARERAFGSDYELQIRTGAIFEEFRAGSVTGTDVESWPRSVCARAIEQVAFFVHRAVQYPTSICGATFCDATRYGAVVTLAAILVAGTRISYFTVDARPAPPAFAFVTSS